MARGRRRALRELRRPGSQLCCRHRHALSPSESERVLLPLPRSRLSSPSQCSVAQRAILTSPCVCVCARVLDILLHSCCSMPMSDAALALPGAGAYLQDVKMCGTEAKSGSLILVGPGKLAQPVQVKVYRTSLEHFAVVYPQKKVCRPLGFVNLRHTEVSRLPSVAEKVNVKTGAHGKAMRPACLPHGLPRQYQHHAGLVVRSRQCDSPHSLTFLTDSPKELEAWLSAFDTARTATVAEALRAQPILEEGDEY